jgi:magnesium transporter
VVLLNFDPLRAVVLADRLVVLVPDGADSILSELQKRLFGPHALEDMEDPGDSFSYASRTFAFRAIEALLVSVILNLEKELLEVSDSMNAVLRRLHHVRYMSVEALETLRMLKNHVGVQLARAHNTKRAVVDVLDEDEDMALMNLSRQQAEPHLFHPVVLNEVLEDHEDFELLYEACLQSVNTLSTNLELAQHQITNAEEFNMMKLDTARNRLLTAEIIFSLVSMCASLGSLVASLFGMNLTNHLEDSSTAFGQVTAATAISTVSLAALVCIVVSRQGTMGVSRS